MKAPPPDESVPVIAVDELPKAAGFVFGFPTRFGNMPAQVKKGGEAERERERQRERGREREREAFGPPARSLAGLPP